MSTLTTFATLTRSDEPTGIYGYNPSYTPGWTQPATTGGICIDGCDDSYNARMDHIFKPVFGVLCAIGFIGGMVYWWGICCGGVRFWRTKYWRDRKAAKLVSASSSPAYTGSSVTVAPAQISNLGQAHV